MRPEGDEPAGKGQSLGEKVKKCLKVMTPEEMFVCFSEEEGSGSRVTVGVLG